MRQYIEGIKVVLQQPRTRWLLLLAVALSVVFGVALWDQFWRDTTTHYVRSDVSVYVRVSVPKYYATSQFEAGLEAFLDDAKLPIDARDIKREIAFAQYTVGSSSVSQVIIRTDRLSKVEEKLRASSHTFERLSGEHLIIGLDKRIILPVQNEQLLKIEKTAGKSLIVYLAPQSAITPDTYLTQLITGTTTDPVLWYGKARRGNVALYPAQADVLPEVRSLVGDSNTIVWAQNQSQLSSYVEIMNQLTAMGKWFYTPEIDATLRDYTFSRVSLIATPRSYGDATGWILADYNWQLALGFDAEWTSELQMSLERMIASIVAFELPQPAIRRLSDGTAVTVIRPDADHWQFEQGSDESERVMEVSEKNVRIILRKTDAGITITNNQDRQWPDVEREGYGQLPARLLPNIAPWEYLQAFSSFVVDDPGVILY
jgi:hypothetical protein